MTLAFSDTVYPCSRALGLGRFRQASASSAASIVAPPSLHHAIIHNAVPARSLYATRGRFARCHYQHSTMPSQSPAAAIIACRLWTLLYSSALGIRRCCLTLLSATATFHGRHRYC